MRFYNVLPLVLSSFYLGVSGGDHDTLFFEPLQKAVSDLSAMPTEASPTSTMMSNQTHPTESPVTVPADPIYSSCKAFIDAYSAAAANYTQCSLAHARPLRFCENCVEQYLRATHLYQIIMEGGPKDDAGRLCRDLILNSDRIRIVVRIGSFIEDLWQDCFCQTCFDAYDYCNGTAEYTMSNETLHFLHLANRTKSCFNNHTFEVYNVNVSSACIDCRSAYFAMNQFYDDWESSVNHQLCMDIVDIMNSTRQEWSGSFMCHQEPGTIWPMMVVTGLLLLVPILFYTGTRLFSDRLQRHISKQHRLRVSRRSTVSNPTVGINDSSQPGYSPRHTTS